VANEYEEKIMVMDKNKKKIKELIMSFDGMKDKMEEMSKQLWKPNWVPRAI
jgi:hypothetical protein